MAPRSILLATSFPPTVGGMETLLYETVRRLTPTPLVLAAGDHEPGRFAPGIEVWPVSTRSRGPIARAAYRAGWWLHPSLHYLRHFLAPVARAVRARRPAVLQVGHVYLAPVAWLLGRRTGLPFVVYAHGQEVWRAGRRVGVAAVDRQLRGRALAAADAVLVQGEFTRSLLGAWPDVATRIVSVPFGASPVTTRGTSPNDPTLLSVGRLVPRKGIDTVLQALPAIAAAVPDVEYRVVGQGPDRARLEALATSIGVADRVRFLGPLNQAELAAEYERCSVFALPTRRTDDGEVEGYGLVFLEAAAHGRPVVGGRAGGAADAVVDGETGVLVDATSGPAVAAAITELLRNPERARALGEAGRRRVKLTHNWDHAALLVDHLLTRVAARGAGA